MSYANEIEHGSILKSEANQAIYKYEYVKKCSWYSHIHLMLKPNEEVKQTMHKSIIKSSYDHEIKRYE